MTATSKLPIDSCHLIETLDLIKQASNLVNPSSGIANDFLNQYNEVLLLVENLPVLLPEMVAELLSWRKKTYEQYFEESPLPGGDIAIRIYHMLNRDFVSRFEAVIERINGIAELAIQVIGKAFLDNNCDLDAEQVEEFCSDISAKLRREIENATTIVNYGLATSPEASQDLADRLMQA
jgi:hypothetical protein